VRVTAVDDVTQFPEILDGRVKTLHPKIHGGLLALRDNDGHMKTCKDHDIPLIDLVVVNLYPFEKTINQPNVVFADAIENIDIGGPSMIRSAAKNYHSVGVVVNPDRYEALGIELRKNNSTLSIERKRSLACEAFSHTANYDTLISKFFISKQLYLEKQDQLRYGENPHQSAAFYKISEQSGIPGFIQHHGKELSYNNIVDLESAVLIVNELDLSAAAIIKHSNPCGVAMADSLCSAYRKAYESDPVSAFGSIIGLNRRVDRSTAEEIVKTFVEVVVAPGFELEALAVLKKKASLRLIELPQFDQVGKGTYYRYVSGGFLVQSCDEYKVTQSDLTFPTVVKPKRINDLLFANTIVKYVKSNAIVVAKDGEVVGVGAGQMSRIEAVEIALKKAGDRAQGAVLASDAFFPFSDSVKLAYESGIQSVIQPGGSKRDGESIMFCDDVKMSMVFSGIRHFRH
jgi:phosphoribosylaminoimidazolecarboxamide formyltransferase/IMP cyclohydrolase